MPRSKDDEQDFTPGRFENREKQKLKSKPNVIAYLQLIRPLNCLMASFATYIGMVVAGLGIYPSQTGIYALLSVFLVCAAGMAINDYFDIEIDAVNRPKRPIPSGRISRKSAFAFSIALFIAGVAASFLINRNSLLIAVFASALLAAYAWKLKKIMMAGHIAISILVALTFIFGATVNMNYKNVLMLAVLAFLSNTGREIFKSISDIMGDKKSGVNSLAVKFGVIRAKLVATIFIILAVIFSIVPFMLGFGAVYLFFVVIADGIFVLSIMLPLKFSEKLCKLAMLIALFAFLAGAVA